MPKDITESLPLSSDFLVVAEWLACYPDLIISNDAEVSGSLTEKAISHWGIQLGMNFEADRSESLIIHVFPFSSDKNQGGVAIQTTDSEIHIGWKGAAEMILD